MGGPMPSPALELSRLGRILEHWTLDTRRSYSRAKHNVDGLPNAPVTADVDHGFFGILRMFPFHDITDFTISDRQPLDTSEALSKAELGVQGLARTQMAHPYLVEPR